MSAEPPFKEPSERLDPGQLRRIAEAVAARRVPPWGADDQQR